VLSFIAGLALVSTAPVSISTYFQIFIKIPFEMKTLQLESKIFLIVSHIQTLLYFIIASNE
jgi:hypothetical protein